MFLAQQAARALDVELMTVPGFSLDQLMELAGLAVAQVVAHLYSNQTRVITLAGPGNNGGDALVAARHLKHFGFANQLVVYPKSGKDLLFTNLVAQLDQVDVPVSQTMPELDKEFDLVLDGVFGFSFQAGGSGGVREPFDLIMRELRQTNLPVVSIDVPSGWDVELGDVNGYGVKMPQVLVSLTAPKLCAKTFTGPHHFLGGSL
ncbi:YjeF family domain-containing protein [Batrachochytrium salamandrivorans]|nr:YjeF family domain-containing protein [Batrachochytrium salamandrivorans]